MEHGITFLAIIHLFVALLLITFVLLQDSKGGGMGGAFGGGSSQTIFGATGAVNFLVKVTRVLAIIFMLTCLLLTVLMARNQGHSVTDKMALPASPQSANAGGVVPAPSAGAAAGGIQPASSAKSPAANPPATK